MDISQAVLYIMQTASPTERQWASDVLSGKQALPTQTENKTFAMPVFDMGHVDLPSRESLYDDACKRHLP